MAYFNDPAVRYAAQLPILVSGLKIDYRYLD